MKAVGFKTSLPIDEPNSFIEFEMEVPKPKGYEILVKVKAAGVNPVDYKIRQNSTKKKNAARPKGYRMGRSRYC
ncbi:hypothetical protein [Niabella hibiscisoli]|uniref:hypothetical protein n=1 Tax=Niabella hibiscisoli TaxID=1825928 RepID=UPI001F0E2010|nr:hypothetical protein [Niabella hibiscisoli]MCH5716944.1 hypothetical protein [Niabella hibiscisoli]